MMNPNSTTPAPEPIPEQPPTPTPTPLQTTAPTLDPQQQAPAPQPTPLGSAPQPVTPPSAPNGQPPKKKNKSLIYGIIGGIVVILLIVIGLFIAANALTNRDKAANENTTSKTEPAEEETSATADNDNITAGSLLAIRSVCVDGSVANAAPYQSPYLTVMYHNNDVLPGVFKKDPKDRQLWGTYGYTAKEGVTDDPETPYTDESAPTYTEINSVVCLDRDDATATKATTCQIKTTDGDTVALDYYSVKYKMKMYEAKTGKLVQEFEPVNGTASDATCSEADDWDADDPKFYANPDLDEINTRLAPYE